MNLSLFTKLTVLCLATALAACGDGDAASGDGPHRGVPGVDATLRFAHQGTLTLAPGETVELVVKGSPPAPYAMTFFLAGESLDASLNVQKTVANSGGVATIKLRAPNGSTNFALRATIEDGPSSDLSVAVSDQGFGSLAIEPLYSGGRPVTNWYVRVAVGSCDALAETFPADPEGALKASAVDGDALIVPSAPVGPNLAVFVRAGGYAWGCSDEAALVAGTTTDVAVAIINKPIDFFAAQLDVNLTFVPEQPAWDNFISSEYSAFSQPFLAAGDDATALLSAMELSAPNPASFQQASKANNWLVDIKQHLADNNSHFSLSMDQWKTAGLAQQPPSLRGTFSGIEDDREHGQFHWQSLGAVSSGALDVNTDHPMTVAVDPDDTIHLGVALKLSPSRLLGAIIEQAAIAQYPSTNTMVDVLAEIVNCDALVLQGLPSCTGSCIAQLCRNALQDMWFEALETSSVAYGGGQLPLQISGAALLDDQARLQGFSGSWLGNIQAGQHAVGASGPAKAVASPPAAAE